RHDSNVNIAGRRRGDRVKRREFITLLGGAAAACPFAARAQQAERMRRIGVLMPQTADDQEAQTRVGAFVQALSQLGWTIGHNVRIFTAGALRISTAVVDTPKNWSHSRRTSSLALPAPPRQPR